MHSLPVFVRLQGRPVILLGEGDAATAKRQLLVRAGAEIVGEEAQAALAIVAIDDEDQAQAAIARLKARGVLVNAVDRADDCDFTLPAIIDRDPVLIAIGTGGASAGLAKALRQRLEHVLPQSLGALADAMRAGKATLRLRWPSARDRRNAIDAALETGGPLDLFKPFSETGFDAWLDAPDAPPESGLRTFIIQTDDPDKLTLEQARLLGQADLIVHSPMVSPEILARGRADAVRIEAETPPDPLPTGLTVHLVRGFAL